MPNFYLFTMMYGAEYIDMFKRACYRSINYPKNLEAVRGKTWAIYTKREHFEELEKLFRDSPFKLELFIIEDSMRIAGCGFIKTSLCDSGVVLLNGIRNQMLFCIKNKIKMLFCPPDTIFGDGTIPNMLKMGEGEDVCVGVAHARVHPSILDELEYVGATKGAPSNANLVTMLREHAHASWEFAEINHKNNNSYIGGIAWTRLNHDLIAVQHRLPTPYLLSFNSSDWGFWWGTVSFGALDHTWPGERLYRQERFRYCGSSDACMILEITAKDKNVPPIVEKEALENELGDAYCGDRVHHQTNRLFNVIWRENS
jgi:hypothetical protein